MHFILEFFTEHALKDQYVYNLNFGKGKLVYSTDSNKQFKTFIEKEKKFIENENGTN